MNNLLRKPSTLVDTHYPLFAHLLEVLRSDNQLIYLDSIEEMLGGLTEEERVTFVIGEQQEQDALTKKLGHMAEHLSQILNIAFDGP